MDTNRVTLGHQEILVLCTQRIFYLFVCVCVCVCVCACGVCACVIVVCVGARGWYVCVDVFDSVYLSCSVH